MIWNFSGNLPVYQQIMEIIRGAVLTGAFLPGQRIPSVRDLAMEAKVNPNTMQHALQELERTGLLISEGTSGRRVTGDTCVLDSMRAQCLEVLCRECAARFASFGVTPKEAAELLQKLNDVEGGT